MSKPGGPVPPTPPRLAERLLMYVLRDSPWRETTVGDLREEFAHRRESRGAIRSHGWYWRETMSMAAEVRRTRMQVNRRGDSLVSTVITEGRLAARAVWRQPLVNTVIIVTFALGIGANAATFGIADALLLRPFSIPTVDRLVVISESTTDDAYPLESFGPAAFDSLQREPVRTLARLTGMQAWEVNLAGGDQPRRIRGSRVGPDFFVMLGTALAEGRVFVAADDVAGAPPTVIVSDRLWHTLGAPSTLVGSVLSLDGVPHTVIGRAPAGFDFPQGSDVWAPLMLPAVSSTSRQERRLTVIGELADGSSMRDAQAELSGIYARIAADRAVAGPHVRVLVHPFSKAMVDFAMPVIVGLWQTAAVLLLIIAGTNIANLLLARGSERQREMAIRLAIGAARRRLIRLMLIENLMLALMAIPAALVIAWMGITVVRSTLPAELLHLMPGWTTMGVSLRMIVVATGIAVASALLFGLLPALRASAITPMTVLKDGGRSGVSGVSRSRLRRSLVVAEVALALPILLASGLIVVAGQRMASGPQGYNPDDLVRVRVSMSPGTYPDEESQRRFLRQVLDEARATPGLRDVASASISPSSNWNESRPIVVDGRSVPDGRPRSVNYRAVSDRFFETMEIPVREGRGLTTQDRDGSALVAVVSESLAALYWPDASPLGQRIRLTPTATHVVTIVGVSANVIDDWSSARNAPTVYVPVDQWPNKEVHLMARGPGEAVDRLAALRVALARVDPLLPSFGATTMRDAIHARTSGLRFISRLMAAFGMLGLVLAVAGIYSVMAHYVAHRRHEIGVRMALGASAHQVLALTLRHGVSLAVLGIVVGLGLGVGVARLMETAFFGLVSLNAALFIGMPAVLLAIAVVATVLPARRAMSVDPASVLRS